MNSSAALPLVGGNLPLTSPTAATAYDPNVPVQPPAAISMGPSDTSLFFTPNQIHALREALIFAETTKGATPTTSTGDLTVVSAAPLKIEEPPIYPVFYLSSIAYQAPNDWSIWISGRKITSSKNTTTLKIQSITSDHVLMSWQPTYNEALKIRRDKGLFASTDALKNKLTRKQTFTYNENAGTITFELQPNQSFVLAYLATFEGFIESPRLPALPEEQPKETTKKAAENDLTADTKPTGPVPGTPIPSVHSSQAMPSAIPPIR